MEKKARIVLLGEKCAEAVGQRVCAGLDVFHCFSFRASNEVAVKVFVKLEL